MDGHIPWNISDERRKAYAESSKQSQVARKLADIAASEMDEVKLLPNYRPENDMPVRRRNGVRSLSLFSGGGGLDLGFDLAGYQHVASFELLEFAGKTLAHNRPNWKINTGTEGDVKSANWEHMKGNVDFVHGGPPCQPFSIAGRRSGNADTRDMFPEFQRAIEEIRPRAFLAENVGGFLASKFKDYRDALVRSLGKHYNITIFRLTSADFGVPQDRVRVFIVGLEKQLGKAFDESAIEPVETKRTVRAALGLPRSDRDSFAPTLRCTLTGPRQTTSIANSTASVHKWTELGIWPHGVSPNRKTAVAFPTKNQTYRLCVEECQLIQGFPLEWEFCGAVYQRLGMIGNSVCPPVAYRIATEIERQAFSS